MYNLKVGVKPDNLIGKFERLLFPQNYWNKFLKTDNKEIDFFVSTLPYEYLSLFIHTILIALMRTVIFPF